MNQEIVDKVNAALDKCDRRAESVRDAVITAVVEHCAEIARRTELPDLLKSPGELAVEADKFGVRIAENILALLK